VHRLDQSGQEVFDDPVAGGVHRRADPIGGRLHLGGRGLQAPLDGGLDSRGGPVPGVLSGHCCLARLIPGHLDRVFHHWGEAVT
jgi:hypothetical protein